MSLGGDIGNKLIEIVEKVRKSSINEKTGKVVTKEVEIVSVIRN